LESAICLLIFAKDELCIISVNFNDAESIFYIDCSPLKDIVTDETMIYRCQVSKKKKKRKFLISSRHFVFLIWFIHVIIGLDQSCFQFRVLHHEGAALREEIHIAHAIRYPLVSFFFFCFLSSSLLGTKISEKYLNGIFSFAIYQQVVSPGSERVLYEQSILRLQKSLNTNVDPVNNMIYTLISESMVRIHSSLIAAQKKVYIKGVAKVSIELSAKRSQCDLQTAIKAPSLDFSSRMAAS
jgi:hypothetical protein